MVHAFLAKRNRKLSVLYNYIWSLKEMHRHGAEEEGGLRQKHGEEKPNDIARGAAQAWN